jgi:predicted O-linked N-acetylglucosamine transferase (SPINDLY family)
MRQRLIRAFDHFVDLRGASPRDIAQRINQDGIDILIDLKGWMRPGVLGALASRPAPIQATYLGFPGTLGLDFVDYVIADPFVLPPEHRPYFPEKAVLLDCYQVNDRQRIVSSAPTSRTAHGLPEKAFVFCAFHASFKITPEFFGIWMRLLQAVPGSVLWLLDRAGKGTDPVGMARTRENLRAAAAARAVDPG